MAEVYGKATVLKQGSTTIGNVISISGPKRSVGSIDITDLDSTSKEYYPGLTDNGEFTAELQYDPATHGGLTTLVATPDVVAWSIIFTDTGTTTYAFDGFITGFEIGGIEQEAVVTASVTIKITGDITIS